MEYCELAQRLLHKEMICSTECPFIQECPQLILEDAVDDAVIKALEAMIKAVKRKER